MSDLLRMTGMYSGMDTEAIIQQMLQAKAQKVTNLKNDQKKLEWKQTLWQDLNKRIYKLYTGTLSNMRLTGSYAKKKTTVSDPTKATITASEGAVNGIQTLKINKLAKAGYLTDATVSMKRKGDVPIYSDEKVNDSLDGVTPADKEQYMKEFGSEKTLEDLGVGDGTLTVTANGKTFTVDAKKEDSIKDFIQKFNDAAAAATGGAVDIKMEYDKGKITVSGTDADAGFKMSSSAPEGSNKTILQGLGLADASENQTGTFIGHMITEKGDIYLPGDFKNHSEKDKDYKAKVSDITPDLVGKKLRLTVGTGLTAKVTTVEITADMEIGTLTSKLSEGGVKASFDEQNQRFFISSTGTGNKNEFKLEGLDENNRTDDSALIDLGLLAEGVETKDQIELLQSIGCDQVQGYYYAKPMPEEEFFELLKKQQAS